MDPLVIATSHSRPPQKSTSANVNHSGELLLAPFVDALATFVGCHLFPHHRRGHAWLRCPPSLILLYR